MYLLFYPNADAPAKVFKGTEETMEKNFSDDSSDWHSESASDRISEYEGLSNRRAHSSFSEHLDKVSHEIRLIIKLLYSLSKVNPYKSVSKQFND